METIFALSTARGKAGVAVIRVSGPEAGRCVSDLTGRMVRDRVATLCRISDPTRGHIDTGIILTFPEGGSFTGEPVAEFHVHGGTASVAALLNAMEELPYLRIAQPGEFTRRALENERLDLAQVEGLADLIDAETEVQRRQAMRLLDGALGDKAERWRRDLLRAVSLLEVTIDFADEEVPVDVAPEVTGLLIGVRDEVAAEAKGALVAERIRDGFEVAIMGAPNVGKSTLLNALAGREAAITSEIAGTTRDVIEVRMDMNGLAVTLLDTAGLRETDDHVEGIGIERARMRARDADLRVLLLEDADAGLPFEPQKGDIIAVSKSDINDAPGFGISAKTGAGLDELVHLITGELETRAAGAMTATHQRHREALTLAESHLSDAFSQLELGAEVTELAAHEVHSAIRALDSLVGRIDVEHILGEIFASFCLGK